MAPERREIWTDILPRWRASHYAANEGRATHAQRSLLEAVHFLLCSWQHTEERIYLTQLAKEAGLWDGTGECDRSVIGRVGKRLQALAEMGAITYEPSPGWGNAGVIGLPPARASDARRDEEHLEALRAPQKRAGRPHPRRTSDSPARAFVNDDDGPARASANSPARASETRIRGTRGVPRVPRGDGPSNGPAEGGPTTTTPTEAERRTTARHAITTGTTDNPIATAHHAITRPDPQGEADDAYLYDLQDVIFSWTHGVTEAETAIALDTLERADNGTHPLHAAHQAATAWATHPARDHDPTQIPRPPKDLR